MKPQHRSTLISLGLITAALGLAYLPLPGLNQTIVVVSGTELQEPLQVLAAKFEHQNPAIQLDLKFQGSQDIANRYLDDKNDFQPAVLIPANGEILQSLNDSWQAQNGRQAFQAPPQPIAKTRLVAVAWSDRGKVLFPDGKFSWQRIEQSMQASNWGTIGGQPTWGSFDFAITDPVRSNSGQLTLSLFAQAKLGTPPNPINLSSPPIQNLFALVKRSTNQPPRSTDILLQEFITRGPNEADVAMVYESNALYRWQQSGANQTQPYQVYYPDPTIETVSTAAIVSRNVSAHTAQAAQKFLQFLTQPEQQAVFVKYGFRPAIGSIDLKSIPDSPWAKSIPGAEVNPAQTATASPNEAVFNEITRQWERAN
jgi:ABC-type molybdate transport system substrate-binding protein